MRISDWSSDVCSSDLPRRGPIARSAPGELRHHRPAGLCRRRRSRTCRRRRDRGCAQAWAARADGDGGAVPHPRRRESMTVQSEGWRAGDLAVCISNVGWWDEATHEAAVGPKAEQVVRVRKVYIRSEEHTSELQSLMRNSY